MSMKTFVWAMLGFFLLTAATDATVGEKARLRLYDGGLDEQPLQVQANLYNPKAENEKTGEGEVASPEPQGTTGTIDETPEE
jgi:hypothetical protein